MDHKEFSNILDNMSLVGRAKFRNTDGWIIFSIIRSFDGWILIDQTGCINFRFTRLAESKDPRSGAVDLFFSDGRNESYIGAVVLKDIDGVDFI
jgi:hypothetical protein